MKRIFFRVGCILAIALGVFAVSYLCEYIGVSSYIPSLIERLLKTVDSDSEISPNKIGFYLSTARDALAVITDKKTSPQNKAAAIRTYNDATGKCAVALQKKYSQENTTSFVFQDHGETYHLREVPSDEIKRYSYFILSKKINHSQFRRNIKRDGLGAPLVGVLSSQKTETWNRPPKGFVEPVTAVIDFDRTFSTGDISATLSFFDPRDQETVTIQNTKFSLSGDFTAPLAFFFRKRILLLGFVLMALPNEAVKFSGIYFMEPYNPKKIPVLFVHGLLASPFNFINFINELNGDPYFRAHYQPWLFFYPAGIPIIGSAMLLRKALADAASHYPLQPNIVIIGHSMGGIIAKMQVIDSGDILWDAVFDESAKKVKEELPDDSLIKKVFFFKKNPNIAKIIFIATPHHGSSLAMSFFSFLGNLLIKHPTVFNRSESNNLRNFLRERVQKKIRLIGSVLPTSVDGLAPDSPLFEGLNKLPLNIPYYSIIGNRGYKNQPLSKGSDGVVSYSSSHIDGAASELIVPGGHDAYECPETVAEVLRILMLNN